MKKNLKQALVPLAVMVFGAAAAFATNAVKQNTKAPIEAYHYDMLQDIGSRCVPIEVDGCSNVGSVICMENGKKVWASPIEDNTLSTCSEELFRF